MDIRFRFYNERRRYVHETPSERRVVSFAAGFRDSLQALAAPMLTAEFLNNAELLNSAQGDDGSYTQMYRIDDVSISCGREETFYTLDEAMESKLADWYSEVDEPDVLEECEIDGIAAKHARLSLSRGETPKQVDFYCLRDGDWLVYVEFTYPVEQAEEIATQLEGWLDALSVVEGNVNAGDLQWEEVAVYLEVAGEEVFPTLGDLAAWAQPQTYACKHAETFLRSRLTSPADPLAFLWTMRKTSYRKMWQRWMRCPKKYRRFPLRC